VLQADPDADHYAHLCKAALTSRDKFLDVTGFLLSRPDLTDALRSLILRDCSQRSLRNTFAESFNIYSLPDFYTAIYRDLSKIMEVAKNLTKLIMSGLDIYLEVLQAISNLTTLRTIHFLSCELDVAACASITHREVPLQDTVVDLRLLVDKDDSIWYTLSLYPQLRNLTVMSSANNRTNLPAEDILGQGTPFKTLERLTLDAFVPHAVSLLCAWMMEDLQSATHPELKLTHLKVHTPLGLPDFILIGLLNTLRFSPNLRILVLEGLALTDVGPDIIDLIAETCPNLLGLTLVRRHNERQIETKLAAWPHTSAEYASHFIAFSRLRFFSWNFLCNARLDPTPAIMTQFEDGFPDISTGNGWKKQKEMNEIAYFDDAHLMAASFAAHCPTLRTFAIAEQSNKSVCQIDRHANGRIEFLNLDIKNMYDSTRMWNTDFMRGWPPVHELRSSTGVGD
jgi:hypothetical protein